MAFMAMQRGWLRSSLNQQTVNKRPTDTLSWQKAVALLNVAWLESLAIAPYPPTLKLSASASAVNAMRSNRSQKSFDAEKGDRSTVASVKS